MTGMIKFAKEHKKDLFVFVFIFIICTIAVLIFCPFPDFDFYHYQLYNGWAFINNRLDTDFMAAGFRSYWNPYLDALQYLLLTNLNNHKIIYVIVSNIDTVLGLFLAYKIADKILINNFKNRNLFIGLSILYVMFSPVMYRVIDSSRNEMILADFILITVYILLTIFEDNCKDKLSKIVIAGLITGFTIGLKLTAVVYGVTFLICLLCFIKKLEKPYLSVFLFTLSMILAFFITDGYWLYTIYSKFQNPFFPVFNDIFHSPYMDFNNIYLADYSHIRPKNFIQFILYPFIIGKSKLNCYGFDTLNWDSRYAINFVCTLILLIGLLKTYFKNVNTNFGVKNINQLIFLLLTCFFSYEINTLLFGTYRYIVSSSLLYGLILFITLFFLTGKFKKTILTIPLMILAIFITICTQKINDLSKFILFKTPGTFLEFAKIKDIYPVEKKSVILVMGSKIPALLTIQNRNLKFVSFVFPKIYRNEIENIKPDFKIENVSIFSDYLENYIKEILSGNQKIYIFTNTVEYLYFAEMVAKSLDYYSDNSREFFNCTKIHPVIDDYLENNKKGKLQLNNISITQYEIMCELKKK